MNNLFFINTRCQLKPPQFLYLFVLRLSWQNRPFLYTIIPRGNFGFTHMQRAFVCWNRTGSISSSSISVKVLPVQNDRASTLYSCPSRACLGCNGRFHKKINREKRRPFRFALTVDNPIHPCIQRRGLSGCCLEHAACLLHE